MGLFRVNYGIYEIIYVEGGPTIKYSCSIRNGTRIPLSEFGSLNFLVTTSSETQITTLALNGLDSSQLFIPSSVCGLTSLVKLTIQGGQTTRLSFSLSFGLHCSEYMFFKRTFPMMDVEHFASVDLPSVLLQAA
ncbi:Hypothetical protein NTJ_10311 [Nesidiocoris tenuis]|uniref:Uncharacterized protein n=1 Tax=Nesidiocoris tenuis TaxID=355587 RepID=A0ABN7AZB9_9HEMI|nr:Hypothetical protein NTJ_10311 [Nesidiocoris tenuis]